MSNKHFILSVITASYQFDKEFLNRTWNTIRDKHKSNIELVQVVATLPSDLPRSVTIPNFKLVMDINGIYSAYNKGVKHCAGEYVCFLNPDDKMDLNVALETIKQNRMKLHEVIYGNTVIVDDTNGLEIQVPGTIDSFTIHKLRMPGSHQSQLVRTTEFQRLNGFAVGLKFGRFRLKLKYASDYDFYCRSITSGAKWVLAKNLTAIQRLGGASSQHWVRTTLEINLITWYYGGRGVIRFLSIMSSFFGAARFHIPRQAVRSRK